MPRIANIEQRLNFSFVIPGSLAGLAMPGLNNPMEAEVNFLKKNGIAVLLNLGDMEYFYDEYRQLFRVIDEPIVEFQPPSRQQMERIVRIFMSLKQGAAMGVHCAGGAGRTGTVLACVIGKMEKIPGAEAIRKIRAMRPGSIESTSQEKFIQSYLEQFSLAQDHDQ